MKHCNACNTDKELCEFSLSKKHGHQSQCKSCKALLWEKYKQEHPSVPKVRTKESDAYKIKINDKGYYINHPFVLAAAFDQMIGNAKKRAKKTKSITCYALTRSIMLDKVNEFCKNNHHSWVTRHPFKPSFDRIDNSKGYTDDNTQVLWIIDNYCKNTFTSEEVLMFCKLKLEQAN